MVITRLSPEEYLLAENEREERAEYFDGGVEMMAGARPRHKDVVAKIGSVLGEYEERGGYPYYVGNTRVKAGRNYLYPDLCVVCDPIFEDSPSFSLLNPRVVIEVLSPSTEKNDYTRKADAYRAIPSLFEYAIVHTMTPRIELYRRLEDGWLLVDFTGEDAFLPLLSLGLDLPFTRIYARRIAAGWAE